jgi:hypothetical protein
MPSDVSQEETIAQSAALQGVAPDKRAEHLPSLFNTGHWFSLMGMVLPFEIITYAI